MLEAEQKRVQRLAGKVLHRRIGIGLGWRLRPGRFPGPAVGRIADQGMAQMGEVDPDLMGTTG